MSGISNHGPQQRAPEHVADETIQADHARRSLWSAAMHGISPFISKDTVTPNSIGVRRLLPDEPSAHTATTEEPSRPGNDVSTDTQGSQAETHEAGPGVGKKHDKAEAKPSFHVRRMVLSKTSKYNPAVHRRLQELSQLLSDNKSVQKSRLSRKANLLQQSQQDKPVKRKRLFRKVNTLQPPDIEVNGTSSVKPSTPDVTSAKHDQSAPESVGGPFMTTIQRQIQELAEQVKMLKDALDALTSKFDSSPIYSDELAILQDKQDVLHASPREIDTGQPLTRRPSNTLRPAEAAARRGHRMYRKSTIALINIVKSLESDPSLAAAQIDKRIRSRLVTIAQQAAREEDLFIRRVLIATGMFEKNTSRSAKPLALRMLPPIRRIHLRTNKDRRKLAAELPIPVKNQTPSGPIDTNVPLRTADAAKFTESEQTTLSSGNGTDHLHANVDKPREEGLESKAEHSRSMPPASLAVLDSSLARSSDTKGLPHQKLPASTPDATEQSLLEELFPEANAPALAEPIEDANKYPKLDPPSSDQLVRPKTVGSPKGTKQQMVDSFVRSGEDITVLQLQHCSTELTEFDFRRLIPKGQHIEAWNRDSAYYKVIPGRNPISLERLPFYYILFKSAESAYAYQNNVTRLHKLAALHQPSNIFSAIPAPRGFLEDGEDIDAITSSYLLRPTEHAPAIRTLMQPYHPGLRFLFTQGGYTPIMPDVDEKRNRIYKVLMHIEGYEPSFSDLFTMFRRDAASRGLPLPLRNESITSLHRLRDLVNLKTHVLPVSTANPRAYDNVRAGVTAGPVSTETRIDYDDPNIAYFMKNDEPGDHNNAKEISQVMMNQVYNRWILDFDDEDEARRFAIGWHRRALPELSKTERTWKDYEESRMCNAELLW